METSLRNSAYVAYFALRYVAFVETALIRDKGKGKGLDTCYSATYTSQTRDQQRFTITEVAADWHEPLVPQRIMWRSIAQYVDGA